MNKPDQIRRLLGDLEDTLQAHRQRAWGPDSDNVLLTFLGWFCEELARALLLSP